jgi:hypothetical protein
MEEDDLQFMGWLLGLETDHSVDGLSNNICQFCAADQAVNEMACHQPV